MILSTELKYRTRIGKDGKEEPPETKRKVFISYHKKDNTHNLLEQIIYYILKASDCAVWYDLSLTPGEKYDEEINVAIKDCDAVILLLTKNVLNSHYIWDVEVKYALEYNKGIIPIALGLSTNVYEEITKKIGKIHIVSGAELLFGKNSPEEYIRKENSFIDSLSRSLHRFVLSHDIAKKVSDFFATKKDELPFKFLTIEQIYLLAYGLLNGLNIEANIDKALTILESLISFYSSDEETDKLKGIIAFDLMMYYIKTSDINKALDYSNKAIYYKCINASNYLGQMYWAGELVEKNIEKALELFEIGITQNDIFAIRLTIKLLLQNATGNLSKYKALQPYYEKAAIYGEKIDMFELIAFYWNIRDIRTLNSLFDDNRNLDLTLKNSLLTFIDNTGKSNMRVLSTESYVDFNTCELMTEILFADHSFKLYKKRTGENESVVFLARNEKTVIFKENCCWGWGECPTFDLVTADDFLCLEISDFDHYCVETIIESIKFINPLSENILAVFSSSDWIKGRLQLKFSAYMG